LRRHEERYFALPTLIVIHPRQPRACKGKALESGKEYLHWVCERIVMLRLRADPASLAPTAATFRSLLLGSFAAASDELLLLFGSLLSRSADARYLGREAAFPRQDVMSLDSGRLRCADHLPR
jgi:hypothetical protein